MNIIRNWVMVGLAGIFILLYTVALLGWLKPLSDVTLVARLEPLIFVIIGYYFGRLPAQQHEQALEDEILRQTKKAEGAHSHREQIQQEREALEEKLKNIKVVLKPSVIGNEAKNERSRALNGGKADLETLQYSVKTALDIINS